MAEMDKTYQPETIEAQWGAFWEAQELGKPADDGVGRFSMVIPPPNVTGHLHMGHGFQLSLMDVMVRYHRMMGKKTLWQVGTDHAGIATQMLVERRLAKEGKTKHALGRARFLDEVWAWKHESGGTITSQMRRLGASVDWSRERFTLDDALVEGVHEAFVTLFRQKKIYRKKKLVNWDPVLKTAVSDLEVLNTPRQGHLWHMRYPLASGEGHFVVATTRPETLFGDVAVAVHPEDVRYQKWIGQSVQLPLTDRLIPIIADDAVDAAFGTGCVKITPAHDFNDHAMGARHDLPLINILHEDATLNEAVPAAFQGLSCEAAREAAIKALEALDLMEKIEPYENTVPCGDRSGAVIQPYLTDQWFMEMKPLAKPALEAVASGAIRFVPEGWTHTYNQWLNEIEDWCISRQLWWGHRIPAWYDEAGNIYVGRDEADARAYHKVPDDVVLHQDEDVLDTWFSSALWPFSSLGWPKETPELSAFFPTDILVTGFDIIFFWVARMIMMSLALTGKVPFREVYVTGLIRDHQGQKMSKSKGNVLDPLDIIDGIDLPSLIEKRTYGLMQPEMQARVEQATREAFPEGLQAFGTDALRFTFCALSTPGRNIQFDVARLTGYRNFCNKLWNAARFVLMHLNPNNSVDHRQPPKPSLLANRWMISQLHASVALVHQHIAQCRFDLLAQTLYGLIWHTFCDWYLECSKVHLQGGDDVSIAETHHTLAYVLDALLVLAHPVIPFITESIYAHLTEKLGLDNKQGLCRAAYIRSDEACFDKASESAMAWLQEAVMGFRSLRSSLNLKPSLTLQVYVSVEDKADQPYFEATKTLGASLARVAWEDTPCTEAIKQASTSVVSGGIHFYVPLASLIDPKEELQRLEGQRRTLEKDLAGLRARLANDNYVRQAPEAVVAKTRADCDDKAKRLAQLLEQQDKLLALLKQGKSD